MTESLPEPGRPAGAPGRSRLLRQAAVGAVLVLAGGLFATSASTAQGSDLRNDSTTLTGLVLEEQERIASRDAQLVELREEVDALTRAVADPAAQRLRERAERVGVAAGLQAVAGPGLVVTLDDAPQNRPQPPGTLPEDLIVHQQDLQGVVNALWAAGADAIMLEDQRLITTSAVRCVGNTLKLQGRLYAPPYTVTAIGDPSRLRAVLEAAEPVRVYRQYVERNGLGLEVRPAEELTVPGWTGTVEAQHARPLRPEPA